MSITDLWCLPAVVPRNRTPPKYFGTTVTAAVISRRRKQYRYGCRTATEQPTCGKRREYCNINETDMWKRRLWRRSRRCCLFTAVANARNFRLRQTPCPSLWRQFAPPPYTDVPQITWWLDPARAFFVNRTEREIIFLGRKASREAGDGRQRYMRYETSYIMQRRTSLSDAS